MLRYNGLDTNLGEIMVKIKKLAVMGSDSSNNLEAIVRWFQSSNSAKGVEITCISDVEDSAIIKKAKDLGILYKYLPYAENPEYFKKLEHSRKKFDLIALSDYQNLFSHDIIKVMGKVINIHPSLLPSFKGDNPIKEAFLAGVKVSGVTVHYIDHEIEGGRIIAQYPVFIANDMHFDEFEYEIQTIEKKLYPIVIEKVLNDQVFDFQDLMKSSCNNHSCGSSGCGGKCGSNKDFEKDGE